MIRKILLFLTSLFVGIGLLVWIIRFVGWQEIKQAFLVFAGWQGIVILALTVLMIIFGIWRWKEILKSQGYNIPLISLTGPYLSWFSLSYLFPMLFWGADVFRGYVLKERFSVPWSKGMASVIIDRVLEWTIYLIVFFVGTIFLFLVIGLPPKDIGFILAGVFVFFSAAIGFFYFKGFRKESIIKFFIKPFNNKRPLNEEPLEVKEDKSSSSAEAIAEARDEEIASASPFAAAREAEKEIFKFLNPRKSFLWKAVGFTFLRTGAALARVWLLIFFLREAVGPLPAISVLGFYYFAMLIPIPATIGSHEAVQIFTFSSLKLGGGLATAFTMIIRGADIILALIGIMVLFKLGMGLLRTTLFKKNRKPHQQPIVTKTKCQRAVLRHLLK